MILFRPDRWSERQQVLAIILMACLLIFLLWFFLLLPQNRRSRALKREIARMREQLQQRNYLIGEVALRDEKRREQEAGDEMVSEWTNMCSRLAAFADQANLARSSVDRIDYKMALFNVRTRLLRKARSASIGLPPDLGIDEEVMSNEDARRRMIQLRAIENLVDVALDLKINLIQQIRPAPLVEHRLRPEDKPYIEEYPVQVECYGTIDHLYDVLQRTLERGSVFMVRRMRVETPSDTSVEHLQIKATLSALVFMRSPEEVLGALPVTTGRRTPVMGH